MNIYGYRKMVQDLAPGSEIEVSLRMMRLDFPFEFTDLVGNPCDKILSGIPGSAFEFGYFERPQNATTVVFFRLSHPLQDDDRRRTFVDYDRRKYYDYDGRFFTRNQIKFQKEH